jgi:nucleoside-diphosphate-sugar epimerase
MSKSLKDVLAPDTASIKQVMRLIDHSGLRIAFITGKGKRLLGAVADSEIRRAILQGADIDKPVRGIINPNPLVLRPADLKSKAQSAHLAGELLRRMPDARYILAVDAQERPAKLVACAELLAGKAAERKGGRSVLVVGGAGYLGSHLSRLLLSEGFRVRVLDMVNFGLDPIKPLLKNARFSLIRGDMRHISTVTRALIDIDAVINLAAVVGDPACRDQPENTIETNYLANKALADACRYHQINRFLYASTCSVYGAAAGKRELTEDAPLNPVSLYARSKIQAEHGILGLQDENFAPTIMRMGTLYGWSPRMRFDLVVNTMTRDAVAKKKIMVHGGGAQWRPLLHVEDAAQAYLKCLKAPLAKVQGETFNVGTREQNYRIIDIARAVEAGVPKSKLVLQGDSADARDYVVNFDKIRRAVGFTAAHDLPESIRRIRKALETREIRDPGHPRYYNQEQDS